MAVCRATLALCERTALGIYSALKVCWNPSISVKGWDITPSSQRVYKPSRRFGAEMTCTKCGKDVDSRSEPFAWLPHLAAEWQGVRCARSGVKVWTSETDYRLVLLQTAPRWPCCRLATTGAGNGYRPPVLLDQARPLNYLIEPRPLVSNWSGSEHAESL